MNGPRVNVDSIPACLKALNQWVVWKYEERAGRKTKIPVDATSGRNASTADTQTWTSFNNALAACQASERYEGIGFVFTESDPFCGIDIDDCLDEHGHLLWGEDLLEVFDSYCEVSPSGRGLKLFFRGRKPEFARCRTNWFDLGTIEVYDRSRWFATTGRRLDGVCGDVMDRQRDLDALCTQIWTPADHGRPAAGSTSPQSKQSPPITAVNVNRDRCLKSIVRMRIDDHQDGSHRLFSACCRCVEHDLPDREAIACIREYEQLQPFPGTWSDGEIAQRLRDAERACERGSATSSILRPDPLSLGDLINQFPSLREPVIDGVLREGETLTVIASPKAGKSWLATDLALTLASGQLLFGVFPTEPGQALVIDNELHPATIANRVRKVSGARQIVVADVKQSVFFEPLRGRLTDIFGMAGYFEALERDRYKVIVLDSLYRFLPAGTDENNNAQMAAVFNQIDAYAEHLGASFVCVHHSSKGSQSGKSVTDVGAGAGAMSRATDSHLILRPHQEPGCVVLEAAVRSWPPIDPRVLRWTFPVWMPDDSLDPAHLRVDNPRRRERRAEGDEPPAKPVWTPERFVETFITDTPQPYVDILDAAEDEGISERKVQKLLRKALREHLIFMLAGVFSAAAGVLTAAFFAAAGFFEVAFFVVVFFVEAFFVVFLAIAIVVSLSCGIFGSPDNHAGRRSRTAVTSTPYPHPAMFRLISVDSEMQPDRRIGPAGTRIRMLLSCQRKHRRPR